MSIALDTTATASDASDHSSDEAWTGSITIGSLSNGILIVEMNSGTGGVPTGVLLDGSTSLTKLTSSDPTDGNNQASLWYLKAPSSGAHTITVQGVSDQNGAAIMSSWSGVDQTTPFGSVVSSVATSAGDILSVVGASGAVLVDFFCNQWSDTDVAPEGSQTRLGEAQAGLAQGCSHKINASYKFATSGSMEMDPSGGASISGGHVGVALLPAAGGGGNTGSLAVHHPVISASGHQSQSGTGHITVPSPSFASQSLSLAFTSRDSAETFTAGPLTSNSVAVASGHLILVACVGFPDVTAAPTAGGLTFTLIDGLQNGSRGVRLYRALVGGGGFSGTVTMFGAGDTVIFYDIVDVAGAVTTGTNGADAIVQSLAFNTVNASPFSQDYANPFVHATNGGYAVFAADTGSDNHPYTARAGWTIDAGGSYNALASYTSSSDTAAGFTPTGTAGAFIDGVMVEIASGGVTVGGSFSGSGHLTLAQPGLSGAVGFSSILGTQWSNRKMWLGSGIQGTNIGGFTHRSFQVLKGFHQLESIQNFPVYTGVGSMAVVPHFSNATSRQNVSGSGLIHVAHPGLAGPPLSTDEPVFGGGDTLYLSEGFDDHDQATYQALAEGTSPGVWRIAAGVGGDGTFVTGRNGTGNAWRLSFAGIAQEIHYLILYGAVEDNAHPLDLHDGFDADHGQLVVQWWARVNMSIPLAQFDGWRIKYFEMFMREIDGYSTRLQFNTADQPVGPPYGSLWQTLQGAYDYDSQTQPVRPAATEIINAGLWYRNTVAFQPNSAEGANDGFGRLWINGTKVVDTSASAAGVTPPGGYKTWCDSTDVGFMGESNPNSLPPSGGTGPLRYTGFLRWWHILTTNNNPFTVDTDDITIWNRARIISP